MTLLMSTIDLNIIMPIVVQPFRVSFHNKKKHFQFKRILYTWF